DGAALQVDVAAETRQVLHAEREVELAVLFERDLLLLRHDRVAQMLRVDRCERRQLERNDLAVDAQERRRSRGDVHVARALLHHRLEELVEIDSVLGGLGHSCDLELGLLRVRIFQSAIVTRRISSVVVTPSSTLRIPLMRRLTMPCLIAASLSSAVD